MDVSLICQLYYFVIHFASRIDFLIDVMRTMLLSFVGSKGYIYIVKVMKQSIKVQSVFNRNMPLLENVAAYGNGDLGAEEDRSIVCKAFLKERLVRRS